MRAIINGFKSDEALMLSYQKGNASAFEALYRRHKDNLFNFLYRQLQASALVEELAQDSWLAVIRQAANYRPEARFKTYLYRIAHNRLVDHWRSQRQWDDSEPDQLLAEGSTEHSAILQQQSEQLAEALRCLPAPQRDAILLREEGFSLEEIAEISGSGNETVKSRLRYGSAKLKALLNSNSKSAGQGREEQAL